MSKVEHIYAFVGSEEGEGIVAVGDSPTSMTPLLCGDNGTMEMMKTVAQLVATQTKKSIKILRFGAPEQIGEITP